MAFYFAGFFFLRKLIFADPQNSQKLEPPKFSCYAVWDNTVNIDFSKKVKFHSLTLAVFTAQSFILDQKLKKRHGNGHFS